MKKLLLLCGITMCCLSSYATITLTASPATVNGPTATVTVTAAGETSAEHITDVPSTTYSVTTSPSGNTASGNASVVNYYNITTGSPTSFTFNVSCSNSTATTVTYYMYLTTKNAAGVIVHQMAYSFVVNVNAICTNPVINSMYVGTTAMSNGGTTYLTAGGPYTITVNYTSAAALTSYSFEKHVQAINFVAGTQSNTYNSATHTGTLSVQMYLTTWDSPPSPLIINLANSCGSISDTVYFHAM